MLLQARPNAGHEAITTLQRRGIFGTVITQNVDGLHQAADTENVIDLHGRAHEVICLSCRRCLPRATFHQQLAQANPHWSERAAAPAPDGDADLEASDFSRFEVLDCGHCGGIIKPNVVFFGENVPPQRVQRCRSAIAASGGLLVVGSSLMVFSGFRFAREANADGRPVAAVNLGRTRADELLDVKIGAPCAEVLAQVARWLG